MHVRGENIFPVPPLHPKKTSKHASVPELAKSEAVQLFINVRDPVKPDFELTNENAKAVAEISARLDGLPLAIELATARLSVFTPQALSDRLGNRLKLLRGGRTIPDYDNKHYATRLTGVSSCWTRKSSSIQNAGSVFRRFARGSRSSRD